MNIQLQKFISGAVGGAFDSAMSSFPGIAIVWGAVKGGMSTIKEKRIENFVLFIQNNINLEYFNDENFIDGLAISFENFLKQRSDYKRDIIKNIFLGFTKSKSKDDFEMERFFDVLNRITFKQINIFKKINHSGKISIMRQTLNERRVYDNDYDDYKYLEFLGLAGLSHDKEIKVLYDESVLEEEEYVFLTDFGNDFLEYILE